MFKAHSEGHPLKYKGTSGVRGCTWNQPNGTPERAGGVRKTYHAFMYSLVLLLSGIYPLPAMHSLLVTNYN